MLFRSTGSANDHSGRGISRTRSSGVIILVESICYRKYSDTLLRNDVDNASNPYNQTEYRQALMLKPNTQYRLKVITRVDKKPIEGSQINIYDDYEFYFRTGDRPGTEYSNPAITYTDKAPNDLSTYVDSPIPTHGAKTFYYDYDIAIRFTETYIEQLYEETLKIRLRDQNGKLLGESINKWYLATWLPWLNEGLVTLSETKAEIGCPEDWQRHNPGYIYSSSEDHELRPNRLFKAEVISPLVVRENDTPLYSFEFVTSRYRSFQEHMLSAVRKVPVFISDEDTEEIGRASGRERGEI